MARVYGFASWLCGSVGVAMLTLSLILVPSGGAFAQDAEPQPGNCLLYCACSTIPKDCTCRSGSWATWCQTNCTCPDLGFLGCGFCG
jgi:hypothetical protein